MHRTLGVTFSQVRSLSFDIWNEQQLDMVKLGGNQILHDYFDKFDLNGKDIEHKYKSKAADYYRKRLASLV